MRRPDEMSMRPLDYNTWPMFVQWPIIIGIGTISRYLLLSWIESAWFVSPRLSTAELPLSFVGGAKDPSGLASDTLSPATLNTRAWEDPVRKGWM